MERSFEKIVLNMPHSTFEGTHVEEWSDKNEFVKELCRWTDWHTDWIFDCGDPRVDMCKLPLSRFSCDVERLIDDPLEKEGQGIIYTKFNGLVRNPLTEEQYERTMDVYYAYHELLKSKITPKTLLIDCHSFPAKLSKEIDICIGFNEDSSKPSDVLFSTVKKHFQNAGFNVQFNKPYANSMAPNTGFDYPSLMIEINKHCYLSDMLLPIVNLDKITKLRETINELYHALLFE